MIRILNSASSKYIIAQFGFKKLHPHISSITWHWPKTKKPESHTYPVFQCFFSCQLAWPCVCLCGHVRVYASVCWILTAITSDTKWLFSEGFAPFHAVIASLRWRSGPLLHAALSHDSCNIYMFTLTISICCFWNNQRRGAPERNAGGKQRLQVALNLGFMIGRLGLIMLDSAMGWWRWWGGGGGEVLFSSRPSQGFWRRAGRKKKGEGSWDLSELALGEKLHQGEISHCGPVTPLTPIQLAGAKLTNGFQIHYKINGKVQMWSKTF